jgi:hypothetical protein
MVLIKSNVMHLLAGILFTHLNYKFHFDFNWYFLIFIFLHNGNICFYTDYCQTTVVHTRTKYL